MRVANSSCVRRVASLLTRKIHSYCALESFSVRLEKTRIEGVVNLSRTNLERLGVLRNA